MLQNHKPKIEIEKKRIAFTLLNHVKNSSLTHKLTHFGYGIHNAGLKRLKDSIRVLVGVDVNANLVVLINHLSDCSVKFVDSIAHACLAFIGLLSQAVANLLRGRRIKQHVVSFAGHRIQIPQSHAFNDRIVRYVQEEHSIWGESILGQRLGLVAITRISMQYPASSNAVQL